MSDPHILGVPGSDYVTNKEVQTIIGVPGVDDQSNKMAPPSSTDYSISAKVGALLSAVGLYLFYEYVVKRL